MARRVANTKHFKVSKLLAERLRLMSPGEMLPTIEELKRKYDCSQATIMQALDRLRMQRLIERPSGKKRIVVAQNGVAPKFRLNLIRPLWSSPDYDGMTNRVYELGHKEHFGFGLYIYSDIEELNIDDALQNADAGLMFGNLDMSPAQITALNGSRKPIVFLRDKPRGVRAGSVWVDDLAVGLLATGHLLELGHRRIAVMLSEPPNPSSSTRLEGWRQAMAKAKTKDIDSLIVDCSVESGVDAMSGSYARLCQWLDERPLNFSALFCVGWTGALAALRAFRERGIRVPEQMSVITFASEAPICDFTAPPLTAVQVDLDHYTREVIRLIEENLAGGEPEITTKDIALKPHLVIKQSTAAPARLTFPEPVSAKLVFER
ncbi:MAG TPA: substrate-binding domain-containing protein [Chthoniobacteraceae bacterium]|jgi:DNA-binding LacI/PurR family transcriptional regulator|nr:substrate-binding domain-containing protein [Chthoniobacteraceae bacterium]